MKEILTWGDDIPAQFDRLGIKPLHTYTGTDVIPSVYQLSEKDFAALCADSEDNWTDRTPPGDIPRAATSAIPKRAQA